MQPFIDWLFYDPTRLIGLTIISCFAAFALFFVIPFFFRQWHVWFPPKAVYNLKEVTAKHVYASETEIKRMETINAYRTHEISNSQAQLAHRQFELSHLKIELEHRLTEVLLAHAA